MTAINVLMIRGTILVSDCRKLIEYAPDKETEIKLRRILADLLLLFPTLQ